MPLKFSSTLRNARATAIINAIDAGGVGSIELYSGFQPATGGVITTQTLLATAQFFTPCGSATAGTLTFNAISNAAAIANGFIEWARILNGSGQFVMDLDCGDASSNAALRFADLETKEGGSVIIASASITEGNL